MDTEATLVFLNATGLLLDYLTAGSPLSRIFRWYANSAQLAVRPHASSNAALQRISTQQIRAHKNYQVLHYQTPLAAVLLGAVLLHYQTLQGVARH